MSNYKESPIAGIKYTRALSVEVSNPLDGDKTIAFGEEEVVDIGGATSRTYVGQLFETLTPENAGEVVNLIDPATGEVVGTTTFQGVYDTLYALYFHLATKRDAEQT